MRRVVIVSLAALVAAAVLSVWVLRSSLPGGGEHRLPTLSASVTLRFDAWERPFVAAETFEDALAAQGWLHARHRLWQMELLRRASQGRLAEMLGQGGVATDKQLWRFGVPQLGQRFAENASPTLQPGISSYVEGINAALASYKMLPPEFLLLRHHPAPWTVEDVYAISALLAFQSANNADRELLRLALAQALPDNAMALFFEDLSDLPDYPFVLPESPGNARLAGQPPQPRAKRFDVADIQTILDPINPLIQHMLPSIALGSNGWVVAPSRSTTDHALFAFDSHDQLGLPNLFYEVHLVFEDRALHGWSVPGLPGVVNGYNDAIAWGFTNIGDTQDLFLETRGDTAHSFVEDGETYTAEVERVTLTVRGAAAQSFDVVHTRNGPLIHEDPPLSLAWTAHKAKAPSGDALLRMNLATDWATFNAALDQHTAPTLNATYADVMGNIGFRTLGVLPRRAEGEGLAPLPASADHRWRGLVLANAMPRLENPEAGYIAAANARVAPRGSYPLVSADNAAAYRIQRIQTVLAGQTSVSSADMQALQLDWMDAQALSVLPDMLKDLPEQESLGAARATLSRWLENPEARRDSAAALLFQTWYLTLADGIFGGVLQPALYQRLLGQNYMLNAALDTLIRTDKHADWWRGERGTILADSLQTAITALHAEQGSMEEWRLERSQSVALEHELSKAVPQLAPLFSAAAQPWGGSPATVGRASYKYRTPFSVTHGATVRAVGEMTIPPRFRSVIPGGQSGHPLSPHYSDQFSTWLRGELLPVTLPSQQADVRLYP